MCGLGSDTKYEQIMHRGPQGIAPVYQDGGGKPRLVTKPCCMWKEKSNQNEKRATSWGKTTADMVVCYTPMLRPTDNLRALIKCRYSEMPGEEPYYAQMLKETLVFSLPNQKS